MPNWRHTCRLASHLAEEWISFSNPYVTHISYLYNFRPGSNAAQRCALALQIARARCGTAALCRFSRIRSAPHGHRPHRHRCAVRSCASAQVQLGHKSCARQRLLLGGQLRGENATECFILAEIAERQQCVVASRFVLMCERSWIIFLKTCCPSADSIYAPAAPRPMSHLDAEFDRITRLELEQMQQQNPNASLSVPRAGHRPSSRNTHTYQQEQLLQQQQQQQQLHQLQQQQNEQFLRSASARLPARKSASGMALSTADDNAMAPGTPTGLTASMRDGERKREESMKRLLEWKQRMLQSPLTRKGVSTGASLATTPSALQHEHAISSGGRLTLPVSGAIQRSRSESHAAGYASYSSDDDGECDII